MLPHIVWIHVNCCDLFPFELRNTVLLETTNQRNVEVIDNTTITTSPSCILSKKMMFLT